MALAAPKPKHHTLALTMTDIGSVGTHPRLSPLRLAGPAARPALDLLEALLCKNNEQRVEIQRLNAALAHSEAARAGPHLLRNRFNFVHHDARVGGPSFAWCCGRCMYMCASVCVCVCVYVGGFAFCVAAAEDQLSVVRAAGVAAKAAARREAELLLRVRRAEAAAARARCNLPDCYDY